MFPRAGARSSSRFLPRLILALLPFALVLAVARPAQAYSWMIRHGYVGCTTCHADPSGGELLTKYGRMQGDLLLRMRWGKDDVSGAASKPAGDGGSFDSFDSFEPSSGGGSGEAGSEAPAARTSEAPKQSEADTPAPSTGFLWGLWDTPDWLLLGGSLRLAAFSQGEASRVFPMQADLYGQVELWRIRAGGSIGAAKVKESSANARAAFVTTNQGNELNLISRTHWVGVDLGPQEEWTIRGGRLNVPFGVRIPEHFMWVRDATRTDRDSDQQHGAAIAYGGQLIRGEVMGIAGNYQIQSDYRERGYSGYVEASLGSGLATGVSSLITVADKDRVTLEQTKTTRGAHGAFARMKLVEPLVLLAEGDALTMSRRELGYVGFLQADFEVTQGLHLIGTGELLDNGYRKPPAGAADVARLPGAGKPRFGGWASVDWFFLPQLELRLDLMGRQDGGGAALAQLHAYL